MMVAFNLNAHAMARTTSRIDLVTIRSENPLPPIVGAVVRLERVGNELRACCPFHADRSPSFYIFADGERWHCFGCGASGDVFDFIGRAYGVGLIDAARMLSGGNLPKAELPDLSRPPKLDRMPEAQAIFERAIPAAGTLAEAYMQSRGIPHPFPPDIRFSRLPCGKSGPLPCMVCGVRDVVGDIIGVQRVYLRSDGRGKADLPKPKLSLGRVHGGAIRLGDLVPHGTVTVCEGPEDGLSLLHMLGGPVWVAAGAQFLPAMQFPAEVQSIVIGADNDLAGRVAARKAAERFASRGLSVRILYPANGAKDFNAELREALA